MPDNSGAAPPKLAVCWFDILLLAVLLMCGFALWAGAGRGIVFLRQHHQPEKLAFERAENGPMKRAELAAAEREHEVVHAAQMEAEMATARLTAELQSETQHPPITVTAVDEWTKAQRDRQVKLGTAVLSAKALTADAASKLQRVLDAQATLADAERIANMRYVDARQEFEITTRLWTVATGAVGWFFLLICASIAVSRGGRWVGKCNGGFVLVSACAVLCALACYELLR